jgi:hypothetical protein
MNGLNTPRERTPVEHVNRAIKCFNLSKDETKDKDLLVGQLVFKYISTSHWGDVMPILDEFLKD